MKAEKTEENKGKTYLSIGFLKKLDNAEPYMRELLISLVDEVQSKIIVNEGDFNELKDAVKELTHAQKKTESNIRELTETQKRTEIQVGELTEAQKRTEIQVGELTEAQKRTEIQVRELTEAQKRTEIQVGELTEAQKRTEIRMEELTEAQKRTEIQVRELTEAQKRTEIQIGELTEAQKRTEIRMEELAKAQRGTELEVKDIKKQLGGLAMSVGYGIEDRIIPHMYDFGKREFDTDVKIVERRNLVYPDGKYDEINIYAEGTKNGHPVFIIGECKAQPGRKDFDRFSQLTERVKKTISGDICAFIAGYSFSPEVEAYAKKKYPDIKMYKTYEFELKSKGR